MILKGEEDVKGFYWFFFFIFYIIKQSIFINFFEIK